MKIRPTALVILFAALNVCAYATAQTAQHHGPAATARGSGSSFEREMDESMARMMKDMHSPGYSGNADVDFLVMMMPHHQGAVEMAKLVLLHGRDPAVRMLAEEIIAGQTIEIDSMRRRLAAMKANSGGTDYPLLGGSRGP